MTNSLVKMKPRQINRGFLFIHKASTLAFVASLALTAGWLFLPQTPMALELAQDVAGSIQDPLCPSTQPLNPQSAQTTQPAVKAACATTTSDCKTRRLYEIRRISKMV